MTESLPSFKLLMNLVNNRHKVPHQRSTREKRSSQVCDRKGFRGNASQRSDALHSILRDMLRGHKATLLYINRQPTHLFKQQHQIDQVDKVSLSTIGQKRIISSANMR